ncbi:ankyrin repeat domain-containing protein [Paenibacillus sinopodophylli]|uniref:ankyrin repeat domain-containing protein n=1 Tax=Paenibacillus sinopodophylli TaxID=1837342 RepID=UPI00110D2180|nr:ankyrin repeat domain-containing protein [Paenibacillus sinopodophylli]
MYKIGDLGNFETLPDMCMLIYEGKSAELEAMLKAGREVSEQLALGRYSIVTLLDIALILNKLDAVKMLVEHGAELNSKQSPAILLAIRYGDEPLVRYIHEKGAKLTLVNEVKSNAYDEAYYGNKRNIPLLRELGLDIVKYGGKLLRKAVADQDKKLIEYLLDHGVDINFNEADMIYPYKATPVTVAARMNSLAMVKYLVERGADVTIAEKDGERAYTIAITAKNIEMAEYLKGLEHSDFHDISNKLYTLKGYGLPNDLIAFLTSNNLRIKLPANELDVRYVDFLTLVDTVELKAGRQKLIRLSAEVDQYSHLHVVWDKSKKGIGVYDVEHKEYGYLGKFSDFQHEPLLFLEKMFG